MQTLTKKKKIWLITGICVLVFCVGIIAAVLLWQSGPLVPDAQTEPPVQQTTLPPETTQTPTTEATEAPTEPTEPPVTPNRFTPDDFAYVGDYLTCVTEDCQMGIDVSKYQSTIDWKKVKEAGFQVSNIDVTMIAQRPKLKDHITAMRGNIARVLELEVSQVNVKATTEEHLGFTGDGSGMSCHAVCLLENL